MKTEMNGSRWYCLFMGYHTQVTELERQKLVQSCSRYVDRVVVGDKRIFFEVHLSGPQRTRTAVNLGSLQFKIQSFAETWDLPFQMWQWGVGKTLAEAWVQTRWKSLTPDFLPIEALDDFIYPMSSPLVMSKDLGLGSSTFNLLRCLGYQTMADLKLMPHDLLLVRLAQVLSDPEIQSELADPNGLLQDQWLARLTDESFAPPPEASAAAASFQAELFEAAA